MAIDYAALRGEKELDDRAGIPEDGLHRARLEKAETWERDSSERIITEWSNGAGVWWTTWFRFDATPYGMPKTIALLDALGVDRSRIADGELDIWLTSAVGKTYQVRTRSRKGSQGDKWFTDTEVVQAAAGDQQRLSDIPADTRGLPDPEPPPRDRAAELFGDDAPF